MPDDIAPNLASGPHPAETPVSPVVAPFTDVGRPENSEPQARDLLGSMPSESPVSPAGLVDPSSTTDSSAASAASDQVQRFYERAQGAETEEQRERRTWTASVFSIMQYERHPDTGELMVTPEQVTQGLAMSSIKRWAYAWHDQDRFDEDEAVTQRAKGRQVVAGDIK